MVTSIEFEDIFIWALIIGALTIAVLFVALLTIVIRGARRLVNPYSHFNLNRRKFSLIEGEFSAATLAGFKVAYRLKVGCQWIDAAEYCKTRMAEKSVRQSLLERFKQEVVQQFLDQHNVFFHLDWRKSAMLASNVNPVSIYEVKMEAGGQRIQEIHLPGFNETLRKLPVFTANGCELSVKDFSLPYPSNDMVKRNSTMITEEQRQAILARPEFSGESERLAIALLEKCMEPETMSALKEIGLYVEFNKTIAEAERLVVKEIQQGPESESEKQGKIERFKDELKIIRERYQK
jgi:hypothetical protein